jgi:hypothetical protein
VLENLPIIRADITVIRIDVLRITVTKDIGPNAAAQAISIKAVVARPSLNASILKAVLGLVFHHVFI